LRHIVEAQEHGNDISKYGPEPRRSFRKMCEEICLEIRSPMDIRQARDGLDWENMPAPDSRMAVAAMVLQLIHSHEASGSTGLKAFYAAQWHTLDYSDQRFIMSCYTALQGDTSVRNRDAWADALADRFGPPPVDKTPDSVTREEAEKEAEAEAEEAAEEEELASGREHQGLLDEDDAIKTRSGSDSITIHYHVGGRVPSRHVNSTWKRTEQSGPLRYPAQVMIANGKPFGRKGQGGTIIVDVSGSMGWDPKEIEEAMKTLPSLTVGLYGSKTDGATGDCRLCVVGRGGRVGEWDRKEEPHPMGGNGRSDYQAIKAMMRIGAGPYVWVSDGCVLYRDLAEDIKALMDAGKLVRTATIAHAIEYMRRRPAPHVRTVNVDMPGYGEEMTLSRR
jgi:hypothetical protein